MAPPAAFAPPASLASPLALPSPSPSPSSFAARRAPAPRAARRRRVAVVRAAAAAAPLHGAHALVIGGTRFSGLYLVHELAARGAHVTVLNRGSRPVGHPSLRVPHETDHHFAERNARTAALVADRTDERALADALERRRFDVVFDNNGRKLADSKPLADIAARMGAHFVYMSSAGVYLKSDVMPHIEGDPTDPDSRHKGKLDTEHYLRSSALTFTAIRPTYIYGALNYNPLEQWFFERIDRGLPICIPGHGAHLTGLGHVRDLAAAMAACALNPAAYGQVYNVQDRTAVSFDGVARLCANAMGKPPPEIVHYDPSRFDFGKKKPFPFRPQHFFCSPTKALRELDWTIQYDLAAGFQDAYQNDFVHKKQSGGLKNDFETDHMILNAVKGASVV